MNSSGNQSLTGWAWAILSAGGTGAVVAFGVFKFLGQRSLDHYFQRKLEEFRQEGNKEIESLRHRIQSTFSRISKVHDKEFEVLPKAWFLLHDAWGRAFHLVRGFREVPDLSGITADGFNEFLRGTPLPESARSQLQNVQPTDRIKQYVDAISWFELKDAFDAQIRFHNYLVENRIFMTDELKEKFNAVDRTLLDGLSEHKIWLQLRNHPTAQVDHYRETGAENIIRLDDKIAEVEAGVQARLKFGEA